MAAWVFESRLKKVTDKEMQELRAKEPYRLTFDIKQVDSKPTHPPTHPPTHQRCTVAHSIYLLLLYPPTLQARERALSSLPLTIQVGENQTITSSIKDLREKGGQHLIVLAAPKAEMADALLGARIGRSSLPPTHPLAHLLGKEGEEEEETHPPTSTGKTLFVKNNVMIAPFILEDTPSFEEEGGGGGRKGFGGGVGVGGKILDGGEAYVAKPVENDEGWRRYIEEELSDALKQGNEEARKRGIGVVLRKDGVRPSVCPPILFIHPSNHLNPPTSFIHPSNHLPHPTFHPPTHPPTHKAIIRRGLGQPDWRDVVAELTGAKGVGEGQDAYIPLPAIKKKGGGKKKK